jgi:hypothetical protein
VSLISRLKQLLRATVAAPTAVTATVDVPALQPERWNDQVAALGVSTDAWLQQRRQAGWLYADLSDATMTAIRTRWPDRVERTRQAAERICLHEFDLLGSGPRVITDPSRSVDPSGYQPIDWAVDPILGRRFPEGFPHKQWNPDMRPGLADIKWPWEIGRCQHWVTLGQAYRLTGDERYAVEIVRQHADFMAANPVGIGVQFVCTMDVAIRAFNWALAFEMIRQSPAFDATAMARAYGSLFDVGVFIENNLENKYEVTSNHFLSNVVGLYGVGLVFRDLAAGQRWLKQGREWLEQEMRVQVLEDGADYESSIPYHRLVAELFLGGARVAELEGQPLSAAYLASLRRMVEFLIAVQRPDGLMPQVGDADDGRLHIFTDYGTWKPQDGRHLAGPAAFVLREPSWHAAGGDDGLWEAAWWGAPVDQPAETSGGKDVARLFPQAGLAVSRTGGTYLLVTNSRVGTNGFGNHKHNDLLSFEFHAHGVPLIVDPGSYVYTSDPDARNLFRMTGYHNTLRVDDVEQNDVRLDYLFRMFETSTVEHVGFNDTVDESTYTGRHTGYERLPAAVTHERSFHLAKKTGVLSLVDRLTGSGRHQLAWHFHFAPGVIVTEQGTGRVTLSAGGRSWTFALPSDLRTKISTAWYSPSYGVRIPCTSLDLTIETAITETSAYRFEIAPDA